MNNIIGQRVKTARNIHEPPLSQNDLVAKLQLIDCDISRSSLAKIEVGIRKVSDIEVVKIAIVLGVSPNWLLGVEEDESC